MTAVKEEEKLTHSEWMKRVTNADPLTNPVNVDIKPAWNNKPAVKKGIYGENIVIKYLEKKGYIIYKAITNGAHAFDLLAVKEKKFIYIAEVKSKARMENGHTGINQSNYKEYIAIWEKYNMDTFVFFVDEHPQEERIYGNYISALKNEVTVGGVKFPYTRKLKKDNIPVTYFHIATMREITKISKEDADELRRLSNRNYDYK